MVDFIKSFFIAEFIWNWKKIKDFLSFQIIIIFCIFSLALLIYTVYFSMDALQFKYCYTWKSCFAKEKSLFLKTEIVNNILFLMILWFIYKFNTWNIERFTHLKYNWKVKEIFKIIFSFLKIFILSIILFFIINFILIFSWNNYFYFYNILEETNNISWIFPVFYFILGLEMILFLFGIILPKRKK